MKKRLISMLLSVLLLVSLFAGYSLSASADNVSYSTMKYTMQSGDYVLRICQRLGLNYYTCKTAIMKLNNITENQWNKLPVGKVLTLPATDADAVVIATGKGSTLTANPVSTAASTTPVNSTKTVTTKSAQDTLIAQDKIIWYLIPYTLAKGESVVDACNALGINFNSYKYAIQRVNNISNWNSIPAGTTLWLASGSAPAYGTNCIAIYRHTMQSGETAYGVVTQRGLNYNSVKWLLEIVNEIYPDLASIKAGQRFDYPISTTVGLTSNQATGGSTTTTTTTNSSGTTVTTVQKYKLTSGIDTGAASVTFYVGNTKVTEAQAGDTVNVEVNAKAGRAIKNIVVKYANGQADLQLSSYSFTMPKCDVRIDAEFMKGNTITLESNYVGKAITLVNGVSVNGAATGASVMVSTIDPAYEIESISAYYKTILGVRKDVTITSGNGFVMPDSDVTIELKLKPVTTYSFYVTDPLNGSFHMQVNGSTVTKAAKGAQVTIVTNPMEGYSPSKIEVKEHDGSKMVSVLNNTFTMPGFDVDVTVEFDSKGNNIVIVPAQGGTVKASYNGEVVTEAPTGKQVVLTAVPEDANYTLDRVEVTRISDGLKVSVTKKSDGTFTFTMPSGGAIVTPIYKGAEKTLKAVVCLDSADTPATVYTNVSLHVITDGVETKVETTTDVPARYGNYVDLKPVVDTSLMGFVNYVVEVDGAVDDELTNQANIKGYIQMPNKDVTVKAVFSKGWMNIGAAAISGKGTVSYFLKDFHVSVLACQPGDAVTIVAAPAANYSFAGKDSITVTRKDTGAKLSLTETTLPNGSKGYTFTIPAEGVNIQVAFGQASRVLNMKTVDTAGKDLTGESLWQVSTSLGSGFVDNSWTVINVPYGSKVSASMTEAGKDKYELVSYKINDVEYTNSSTNYSYTFTMTEDTTVIATLRSKNPSPTVYSLNITQDLTKGVAECVIRDSKFAFDPNEKEVVKSAHAGDVVAIVPATKAGYLIDENHITIVKKDGGVIHPTKVTLKTGKTGYEFKMPDDGYKSITVDFYSNPFNLKIKVLDEHSNDLTTYGLVRIQYSNGSYNDVSSADFLKAIPQGETIQALISTMGQVSGWKVDSISGLNVTPTEVTWGYSFPMPANDVELTINISGGTVEAPTEVTLPATTTDSSLKLLYYKADGVTLITDNKAMSGDTVIVKVDETSTPIGDGKMLKNGISFNDKADGSGNEVAKAAADGASFTVNKEIKSAQAPTESRQYQIRIRFQDKPAAASLKVDGQPVDDGTILSPNKAYGASIKFEATGARITAVSNVQVGDTLPAFSINSATIKPDASVADGATVDVTVSFQKSYTLKVNLVNAEGATVKVEGQLVSASGTVIGDYVATDIINFNDASRDIISVEGLGTYSPSDSKNGVANMKDAEGSELTATVTFQLPECALQKTAEGGETISYFDTDNNPISWASVFKGTTVIVKGDAGDATKYVKKLKITDADGNVTTISDGGTYVVNAAISKVEITEKADKTAKIVVKATKNGDVDYRIFVDSGSGKTQVSSPATVKNGDKVYVQAHTTDTVVETQKLTDPHNAFNGTYSVDHSPEGVSGTITMNANVVNGEEITIEVTFGPKP